MSTEPDVDFARVVSLLRFTVDLLDDIRPDLTDGEREYINQARNLTIRSGRVSESPRPSIAISISLDATLSIEDIWPDGDAPENPTAADVKTFMESCGTKRWVLDDWGLLDDVTVNAYSLLDCSRAEVWPRV